MKARIIIGGYPRKLLFSFKDLLNLPRILINTDPVDTGGMVR